MKTNWIKLIPYVIIAILLFVLFFKGCGDRGSTTITTPEIGGDFEEQEPIYIKGKDSIITKWKTKEIKTPNPVNDSLDLAYKSAKDLERYKLFRSATQIKTFKNTFEDEYLKLSLTGSVQGDLLGITPKYTIKSQKIEVPETSLRFLIGGGIGNNLSFNDFTYRVNLGIQNAKGNIIRAGYSRMRGQDYIFIGYDFSLFEVR